MGKVYKNDGTFIDVSVNLNFIKRIIELHNTKVFIETGTFAGNTITSVYNYFEKLYTIEASDYFYSKFIDPIQKTYPKISFLLGRSVDYLDVILGIHKNNPNIIYLDSHFMSDEGYGNNVSHPLLEELEIITSYKEHQNIIIIDDFTYIARPCSINEIKEWPSIDKIAKFINSYHDYYMAVLHDVIYCVPREYRYLFLERDICYYYGEDSLLSWI